MRSKSTTLYRLGAGICFAADLLLLFTFLFGPAFGTEWFDLKLVNPSTFQILRLGAIISAEESLPTVLLAFACAGFPVCILLSLLLLIKPHSPDRRGVIVGINIGFGLTLIPYFFLLGVVLSDPYGYYPVHFFSLFVYLLCIAADIAGTILLSICWEPPITTACSVLYMKLCRMNTQEQFLLSSKDLNVLGRNPIECSIVVNGNGLVGRQHALIDYQGGRFCVTDLNSRNKTYLNDICLQPNTPYPLKPGDYITLANEIFAVGAIVAEPAPSRAL